MSEFLLRVPDHLGDGVMAIPAVNAISKLGVTHVVGPPWASRLYNLDTDPSEAKVAVLFKPSFSAAWAHRHIPRRIGTPTDWRRWLLTDAIQPTHRHRVDNYSAIAKSLGGHPASAPSFRPTAKESNRAPRIKNGDVLLLPLSKSQDTVGWPYFRQLADQLNERAVFAAGPGECSALRSIAGPHRCLPPLPIGEFAAVARQAAFVVGNDSGLSHLASASRRSAAIDPASTHVVFGSTDPEKTGPIGCTPHRLNEFFCPPCYRKKCRINSDHSPCLDLSSTALIEAMQ